MTHAHNLKAVGSNPTPATNLTVERVDGLKNLKDNASAVAQLASVLEQLGETLKQVSSALIPSHSLTRPGASASTLVDVVNKMLVAKAAAGVRERYLIQLRHSLNLFGEGRLHRPFESITLEEIEDWSLSRDWAPATRRSYLTDVRTLFNFAVKRGIVHRAVTDALELPKLEDVPPYVHEPDQVRHILHTAQATDLDVMRVLAVQYFSGARPLAEAALLEEKHLLPGLIEIEGPKCKTRRRRLVTVQPALADFLAAGGHLPVVNLKRRWLKVRERAGVAWGTDVTRDSFCSYHLAAFDNAALTAKEAGHSEDVLFSKYRATRTAGGRLITKELAQEFWAIRPA